MLHFCKLSEVSDWSAVITWLTTSPSDLTLYFGITLNMASLALCSLNSTWNSTTSSFWQSIYDNLTVCLSDSLTAWLTDWLPNWLTDWLGFDYIIIWWLSISLVQVTTSQIALAWFWFQHWNHNGNLNQGCNNRQSFQGYNCVWCKTTIL